MNENENLQPVEKLTPFTKMVMSIGTLPSSFYASMSYYESMVWLYEYLKNQVIPTVNNNAEAVEELQEKYLEFSSGITEEVTDFKSYINGKVDELETYMNNYFNNLDVQQEINNKLDAMATDGTLTNLIKNYIDPLYQAYEEQINGEISTFKTDVNGALNNFNTRLTSVASGSPLVASSTSGMTETDRVYVNTTDGKWYYYDGDSWEIGGTYQATENSTTVNDNANKLTYILERGNIKIYGAEYGGFTSNNTEVSNTVRARTKVIDTIHCKNIFYKMDSALKRQNIICCVNSSWDDISGTQIRYINYNGGIIAQIVDPDVTAIRIVFSVLADNTQNITQSQLDSITVIPFNDLDLDLINNTLKNDKNTALTYGVEHGGFDASNNEVDNTVRCRTKVIKTAGVKKLQIVTDLDYNTAINYINGSWSQIDSSIYYKNNVLTIPENCDYVRISFKHTNGTDEITASDMLDTYVKVLIEYTEYANKKYIALGDSITYGFIPRNYAGYPGQLDSFCKLAADNLSMDFTNAGISGNTVAEVDEITTQAMCNRYTNLDNNADLITFMGGINDIRRGVPLGTFGSVDKTTFYGALNVLFGGLYKKYFIDQGTTNGKSKKIVIMTPIKNLLSSSSTQGGTGTLRDISSYITAIKDVANYYSFPVLDMYNLSGINPHLNETIQGTETGYTGYYNPYITDGTHPTQEGHYIMSKVLEGFLKSII